MKVRSEIEKKLSDVADLCTLPITVQRLLSMLQDPEVDVADIVMVMRNDQALTSRTLRLANSALFRPAYCVNNIKEATVYLGFNAIRNLALTAGVMETFSPTEKNNFDISLFWRHSMGAALTAAWIGELCNGSNEDCFVVGLLHDLGKVIIAQHFPEKMYKIVNECKSKDLSFREVEGNYLEIGHAEMGAFVAGVWNFSSELVSAILRHHDDNNSLERMDDVARISNLLAGSYLEKDFGPREEISEEIFSLLGLQREVFKKEKLPLLRSQLDEIAMQMGW